MTRPISKLAEGWWDYTTLDPQILNDAAHLTPTDLAQLGRPGFSVPKADKVSIWHPGLHDNPFGMRLTALMISKGLMDSSVPMSLLADHPNVQFSYLRPGIGSVAVEMH